MTLADTINKHCVIKLRSMLKSHYSNTRLKRIFRDQTIYFVISVISYIRIRNSL